MPIATMKLTKVVDSGSFSEVAKTIKMLATVRLTEARSLSNAGLSRSKLRSLSRSKRSAIPVRHCSGIVCTTVSPVATNPRTMPRDSGPGLKRSRPSSCRLRLTSVCVTERALDETQSVTTMTAPAPIRTRLLPRTGPFSASMVNSSGARPLADHSCQEVSPARGTPMKFTRSLLANASASANVPASTTVASRSMPALFSIHMITVQTSSEASVNSSAFAYIHALASGGTNAAPFKPFTIRK